MCEKKRANGGQWSEWRTTGRINVDLGFKSKLTELLLGREKLSPASVWGSQWGFCVLSCSSVYFVEEVEADYSS